MASARVMILGADVGTTRQNPTAVVAIDLDGAVVEWVVLTPPRDDASARIAHVASAFHAWLATCSGVTVCGIEAPHMRRNAQTLALLARMCGALEESIRRMTELLLSPTLLAEWRASGAEQHLCDAYAVACAAHARIMRAPC